MKCLTCQHCEIDFGHAGHSADTPGSPGTWQCRLGVWSLEESMPDAKQGVLDAFTLGESCAKWKKCAIPGR